MRIHFIAIGGSAMHNLALALHAKGDVVTGSDDAIFEPSKTRLAKQGLLPEQEGWYTEKITADIDAVILGMHAKEDNPELIKAKELGLKIYSYPEFIYEHAKNKTRVVIGGSHGKTTITSMVLHVLNYHGVEVDYLVGAQLEGFDRMVNLTDENDFMLIEGDEYLSSPIDRRPKFHLYEPNIALLSGIAWDHINVFPTFENYVDQFRIFIDKITNGGILIYNEEDAIVKQIAEESTNPIRKIPYTTLENEIVDGVAYLVTSEGPMPLEVFGQHNINNISGAKWVCQNMGIDEDDFFDAITSFKGASKRLEKLYDDGTTVVYKDFAHSPSKVKATMKAVREQYPNKQLVACLELHTYSSLNADFLSEYKGSLETADQAVVFYSLHALKIKRMPEITAEQMKTAFELPALTTYTNADDFKTYIKALDLKDSVLLFMSSGDYGGLDLNEFVQTL
ncbi:UDP-N-acetylmuramate: L-alanyl-gamma-D-glutamyl-meso-diaminopimelate ligase [Myroides gitamensis]|uniref:UDP-N-acetylmuramate--L-alanine ligase n=1 Tax=Myroides odoratus TaxID=256 RepID=UPI0021684319|nr:Mur ligase family protein [Myroides odoratus]MCS4238781.1 UDP-N-acetylmuramate: L-alanyl-gamma-D-glutamyl-meso-diaminopimelate ligase [Myroides odoratus]MDH6602782.1 UDP-N-acetylmuramate: L-alanyl-gamma-D-glutamyl-meso-diaminopimelate ligase [Myroides gitamensis]